MNSAIRIIGYFADKMMDRTGSEVSSVSFNLDNQKVKLPRRGHGAVTRCVYRVDVDDSDYPNEILVGNILFKGQWNRVVYDDSKNCWRIENKND